MYSYYNLQKSRSAASDSTEIQDTELKLASDHSSKTEVFNECFCIPRALRETVIDPNVLELVVNLHKNPVTLLSLGSGNLGQEYHLNKLLTEHGITVQWLLVDKEYGRTDAAYARLQLFKDSMETMGSKVLGAYSDISAYAAFKKGKSILSTLRNAGYADLFTKGWADLYNNIPLNKAIFNRSHAEFETNPLPDVDLVLIIDPNPTSISGYKATKLQALSWIEAVQYLDPQAIHFSVINTTTRIANHVADLEIESPINEKRKIYGVLSG